VARFGLVWPGTARYDKELLIFGSEFRGKVRHGKARHGVVGLGKVRHGKARQIK